MNEEDEAFEELALKQGHWQHTSGWRKKQIMETSMTKDELFELANQAGKEAGLTAFVFHPVVEIFAKLVAEKATAIEREACAKECWKQMGLIPTQAWTVNPYEQCIDAIRARGQA